jgi:eukaryotic-like serine/threonine-protein kinase
MRRRPLTISCSFHQLPGAKALLLLRQNKPAEAIALLEHSRKYELGIPINSSAYPVLSVRGLAYLQVHDPSRAAGEFQKILDHPGINSLSGFLPLARLNLARAYGFVRR